MANIHAVANCKADRIRRGVFLGFVLWAITPHVCVAGFIYTLDYDELVFKGRFYPRAMVSFEMPRLAVVPEEQVQVDAVGSLNGFLPSIVYSCAGMEGSDVSYALCSDATFVQPLGEIQGFILYHEAVTGFGAYPTDYAGRGISGGTEITYYAYTKGMLVVSEGTISEPPTALLLGMSLFALMVSRRVLGRRGVTKN